MDLDVDKVMMDGQKSECKQRMEVEVVEMVPPWPTRTLLGRVVINAPKVIGPLAPRKTGTVYMCCNRAYLTEASYQKHLEEKTDHGEPLDFNSLPKSSVFGTIIQDYSSLDIWKCRKTEACSEGIKEGLEDLDSDDIENDTELVNDTPAHKPSLKKKNQYECPICHLKMHRCNKKRHNQTNHSNDGKYKCQYCPSIFALEIGRQHHEIKVHQASSISSTKLKNVLVARAKKQLILPRLDPLVEIKKGKRQKLDLGKSCWQCGKKFRSSTRLRDHMNSHNGSRPYKCSVCNFRFSFRSNLYRHEKIAHKGEKSEQHFCQICHCGFSSRGLLLRHNRTIHSDEQPAKRLESPKLKPVYPIDTESERNNSRNETLDDTQLPNLTLQHPAPNSNGTYKCSVCGKELMSPQTWRGHMRIHQNLKPYKCELCGQHFRLHSTRKMHVVKSHTNGSFPCRFCTCRFNAKRALIAHMRLTHKNKKVNPNQSSASSAEKQTLEPSTEVTATFKCQLCGKFFKNITDFEDHKVVHKEASTRQCNLCLKTFEGVGNCKAHKKRAHGDGPNKCSFCCARYGNTAHLSQHMAKEHGMEKSDWNFKEKRIKPEALKRLLRRNYERDLGTDIGSEEGIKQVFLNQLKNKDKSKTDETMISSDQFLSVSKEQKRCVCHICNVTLTDSRCLKIHLQRAHYNNGTFKCDKCPSKFTRRMGLLTHQSLYHGYLGRTKKKTGLRFLCTYCNKTFASLRLLKFHMDEHKLGKQYECDLCSMKFSLPSTLQNHKYNSHLHDGEFKCSKCPCKYMSKHGLVNHQKCHDRHENQNCQPISSTEVSSQPDQLKPVARKPNKISYPVLANKAKAQCPLCRKLVSKYKLKRHLKTHKGFVNACDICHQKFSHPSSIELHKKLCHFHDGKYFCSNCPCKFKSELSLKNHVAKVHKTLQAVDNTRENVEQLQQNYYEEDEYSVSNLQNDVLNSNRKLSPKKVFGSNPGSHTGMNNGAMFECDLCHLKFLNASSIPTHKQRSHFHNGKFQCVDCSCKFVSSAGLLNHRARYHGLKQPKKVEVVVSVPEALRDTFQCTFCDKIFKRMYFKRHMEIHTRVEGEKKYECDLCHMKLTHSGSIYVHKKNCHSDGEHHCSLCSCKFKTFTGLDLHLKHYHGQSKDAAKVNQDRQKVLENLENNVTTSITHNERNDKDTTGSSVICELCNLPLGFYTKISGHIKTSHVPNGQFKCANCTCQFLTYRGLCRHNTFYHKKPLLANGTENVVEDSSEFQFIRPIRIPAPASSMATTVVNRAQKLLKNTIKRHISVHKCFVCSHTFRAKRYLEKHVRDAHTGGIFQCQDCSCSFHSSLSLSLHARIHKKLTVGQPLQDGLGEIMLNFNSTDDPTMVHKCHCGCTFSRRDYLRKHMSVAHTNGEHKCIKCSSCFHSALGLQIHFNRHHHANGVKPTKEETRNGIGPNVPLEITRVPIKRNEELITCELCNMSMIRKDYLQKHKEVAHTNGRFKCKQCTCCFHTSLGLTKHRLWHETGFANAKKDDYHKSTLNMQANQVGSPNLSPKVNRNFLKIRASAVRTSPAKVISEKGNFSERIDSSEEFRSAPPRTPTSVVDYRFKCDLCNLRFSQKPYLRRHQEKAHVDGGYECDQCTCSFLNQTQLGAHKRVYHNRKFDGEKKIDDLQKINGKLKNVIVEASSADLPTQPFKSTSGPLGSTRTKNFKCEICHAKYPASTYLEKHMSKAHSGGHLNCEFCPCSFFSVGSLSAHKRIYHNSQTENNVIQEQSQSPSQKKNQTPSRSRSRTPDSTMSTRSKRSTSSTGPVKTQEGSIEMVDVPQTKKFQCDLCPKSFGLQKALEKHILSHTKPETCNKCDARFRTKNEVSIHKRSSHGQGQFQCSMCCCRYTTAMGLRHHFAIMHKKKKSLQKSSLQKSSLQKSANFVIENDQENNIYEDEPFLRVDSTYSQQNDIEDSEPIIQGILETNYTDSLEVDESYTMHRQTQPIYSPNVDQENNFAEHDESEPIVQGIFDCQNESQEEHVFRPPLPPTPQPFKQPKAPIVAKKKTSFSPKSRPIKCSDCGLICLGPEKLRQHMESHLLNNEKGNTDEEVDSTTNDITSTNNACSKCNLRFVSQDDLSNHLNLEHDETGLYRCVYCPCTMKTESNLRSHFTKYHGGC